MGAYADLPGHELWQLRGVPLGRLTALAVALRNLTLTEVNVLLYRSDSEERDSTGT
jgi:hypothetical protein